jgi:hypothetical protein
MDFSCKGYKVALVILQILWHQLLINYLADFFQTCTDDQAGCVDDRKEMIFFLRPFLPELWPFVTNVVVAVGASVSRGHSPVCLVFSRKE